MSQNLKSFDLGKQFYLNLPYLKNYVFWRDRTDSKGKTNSTLNNAYFAILSQNQKHLEKCVHLQNKFYRKHEHGGLREEVRRRCEGFAVFRSALL